MAEIKKNIPSSSKSSLYKEVNQLRALSTAHTQSGLEDEGDNLAWLGNYLKWVGVLSVISLLVGFCTAAVVH